MIAGIHPALANRREDFERIVFEEIGHPAGMRRSICLHTRRCRSD
jgi:hypothetical protein